MGYAVNWAVLAGLEGREGLLVRPSRRVWLCLCWGLDKAAVKGVLRIMVGYYTDDAKDERKKQREREKKKTTNPGARGQTK